MKNDNQWFVNKITYGDKSLHKKEIKYNRVRINVPYRYNYRLYKVYIQRLIHLISASHNINVHHPSFTRFL